jgi:peptide/nickel transport system permease protein
MASFRRRALRARRLRPAAAPGIKRHPLARLIGRRTLVGISTLFVVSVLVFFATHVLPGNAARAILGRSATPDSLRALEHQLHLDRGVLDQFWTWLRGVVTGHLGVSLASGQPVWSQVGPRLANSAVLVFAAGAIGSIVGVGMGVAATLKRDGWFDRIASISALTVTALPEFLIAIALVLVFATSGFQILPAVSYLAPGTYAWSDLSIVVLPVATLVIVIVPYIFRMTRAAMTEALESDYVEMARLKGLAPWRVNLVHALPNAMAPTIQVIGLNFLYLAGGIVVVEYVFNFPGIGQGLVLAVSNRDIPVIQVTVLILAAFYVLMNILTDAIALLVTPRRRIAR